MTPRQQGKGAPGFRGPDLSVGVQAVAGSVWLLAPGWAWQARMTSQGQEGIWLVHTTQTHRLAG